MNNPVGAQANRLKNCCALVAYIPDPLGRFLDDLRLELVPSCKPHAHVTILPPRPIALADVEEGARQAQRMCAEFPPFEIDLLDIAIFPKTDVVYLEVGMGVDALCRMHRATNAGVLYYDEPFEYHPHVTLAQELTHEQAVTLAAEAQRRWAGFKYGRRFVAESLTFVRNTGECWIDLVDCPLEAGIPVRRR